MSELLVVVRDAVAVEDFYTALREAGRSVLVADETTTLNLRPDVAYVLVLSRGNPSTRDLEIVTALSRRHSNVVIVPGDQNPVENGHERDLPFCGAHPGVTAALEMIAKDYSNPHCSARAIARAVGVSEEYLCRLVKAHTGRTIGAFVHDARLRETRRLLMSTAFSVKEIAQRVGYSGAGHLTRHFRRWYCTTPVAFRHAAGQSRTADEISKSADAS